MTDMNDTISVAAKLDVDTAEALLDEGKLAEDDVRWTVKTTRARAKAIGAINDIAAQERRLQAPQMRLDHAAVLEDVLKQFVDLDATLTRSASEGWGIRVWAEITDPATGTHYTREAARFALEATK